MELRMRRWPSTTPRSYTVLVLCSLYLPVLVPLPLQRVLVQLVFEPVCTCTFACTSFRAAGPVLYYLQVLYKFVHCALGRVENCKSSQNQMSQCFFNGFWCIETEGNFFFAKKNIFDRWKWTRNLGFGHFQRFLHFFFEWQKIKFILTIPSMSIVIWNLHAKSFPMVPWC